MNIYDSLFSSNATMLCEQVARQMHEIVPEDGLFVVILDNEDNYWCTDEARFAQFFSDPRQLALLCSRIDDGGDPVISQIDDCGVVATELTAEDTSCGYVVVVLPQYTPESTLATIDLIELALNQASLIAGLIDKNNRLHHMELKHFSRSLGKQSPSTA